MKISSINHCSLSFGKIIYSCDRYSENKLKEFKHNPNYPYFKQEIDKISEATGDEKIIFSIKKGNCKGNNSDNYERCVFKNEYAGSQEIFAGRDIEDMNMEDVYKLNYKISQLNIVNYLKKINAPYVKESIAKAKSHECFEFNDDEQTKKALLLFSMVKADEFNQILDEAASAFAMFGGSKIFVQGATYDIDSAKLVFTDNKGDSKTMYLTAKSHMIYEDVQIKNNSENYTIDSDILNLRACKDGVRAKKKLELEKIIQPFYEDFKNIKLSDDDLTKITIKELIDASLCETLLHQNFEWIDRLAKRAGTTLTITSELDYCSDCEHIYPLEFKDDKDNRAIVHCKTDRYEMFDMNDLAKIPTFAQQLNK